MTDKKKKEKKKDGYKPDYDKWKKRHEEEMAKKPPEWFEKVKDLDWDDEEAVQNFYPRDENGVLIDGTRGQTRICGVKGRRSGLPCKRSPMQNGRCPIHGGKSKGYSHPNNKHAMKTGEHEAIWLDSLDQEELDLYDEMTENLLKQTEQELRLITIRERRMLKRIDALKEKDFVVTEREREKGVGLKGMPVNLQREKEISALEQVQRIEDALTRVQDKKMRLLELKHKIEMENNVSTLVDVQQYVRALSGKAADIWDEVKDDVKGEENAEKDGADE